jgi:hypothetical protein
MIGSGNNFLTLTNIFITNTKEMKSRTIFFIIAIIGCSFCNLHLVAQKCEMWYGPQVITNDNANNRNATLVDLLYYSNQCFLFWEKSDEPGLSEIVYKDYYNDSGNGTPVVSGNGFMVSNPQVIDLGGYNDILGYLFYESDESGNSDINYIVWKTDGFEPPQPFANSPAGESHIMVCKGGGVIWQEADKIRYSELNWTQSGYEFTPAVTIDSGQCFNPAISQTWLGSAAMIAWEKGDPESPQIWYCTWDYQAEEWSEPILLFNDGMHLNIRFSKSSYGDLPPLLISDKLDNSGNFSISIYDFFFQEEFIPEFYQSEAFQPDVFSISIAVDFWDGGYLSFKNLVAPDDPDIYSNDNGILLQQFSNYCPLDQSTTIEAHPQFFQGMEGGDCFNLECIWESNRNGYWQLFSSSTLVIVGKIDEHNTKEWIDVAATPNPLQKTTKISYELESRSSVTINIFNSAGQVVKQIPTQIQDAGNHEEIIDLQEFPKGNYLVRVWSENYSGSVRIIKN